MIILILIVLIIYHKIVYINNYSLYDNIDYTPPIFNVDRNAVSQQKGKEYLSNKSVIITGLIRDSEHTIKYIKQNVYKITKLFNNYKIIIFENDSKDNTRQELLKWVDEDNNVIILGCSGINNKTCNLNIKSFTITKGISKNRINNLSYLRNEYLKFIKNNYSNFDFTIVYDFDINGIIYTDGILNTAYKFSINPEIDAIASQSYKIKSVNNLYLFLYGDSYAYRDNNLQFMNHTIKSLFLSLFNEYPYNFKKVISAFGGFTIYRTESIIKSEYNTYLDNHGEYVCEHVGLHKNMNIYINTNMLHLQFKNN